MKKQYVQAVLGMIHEGGDPYHIFTHLHKVLERKGHSRLYAPVLKNVLRILEAKSERGTTVTVASEEALKKYKEAIAKTLKELDAKDEPVSVIDETIVGGYIVKHKNTLVDNSYKTKLLNLYRKVITN